MRRGGMHKIGKTLERLLRMILRVFYAVKAVGGSLQCSQHGGGRKCSSMGCLKVSAFNTISCALTVFLVGSPKSYRFLCYSRR